MAAINRTRKDRCQNAPMLLLFAMALTVQTQARVVMYIGKDNIEHRRFGPTGTPPKFGRKSGGGHILSRKPAISLKRGKIGTSWQGYYDELIGSRIGAFGKTRLRNDLLCVERDVKLYTHLLVNTVNMR